MDQVRAQEPMAAAKHAVLVLRAGSGLHQGNVTIFAVAHGQLGVLTDRDP